MSDHLWFYELLNNIHGPVSTDDIQQLVADGRLSDTDRIRPETSEEWITVADLRTLVENVASGEDEWEEVTDLEDLNFQFEDSSAGVARAVSNQNASTAEDLDDRNSGLDIDSFQLSGDPEQARHTAFDSVAGKAANETWMVESLGQILGPMAMTELLGMAEAGALSGTDKIRKEASDTWVAAESIEEVAVALAQGAGGFNKVAQGTGTTTKRRARTATASGRGDTAAGKSRPSSQSRSKGRPPGAPGRKRRRKKKRSDKDQLLAEIFSDVFSEDGKVRDLAERPDLSKPASGPSMSAHSAPAAQSDSVSSSPIPTNPGLSSSPGMGAMSGASAGMPGGAAAAAAAARPQFVPPPKKRKKSRGAGFSIDPKALGIGAAVLVVVGIFVAGFMGMLPIPGFGVDGTATFAEFEKEFAPMVDKVVPDAEWEKFRTKYLDDARSISKSAMSSAGTDPASAEALKSALLMIRILEYPQDSTEARQKTYESFKERKK